MDRFQSHPVRSNELPERFQRDGVPCRKHTNFEELRVVRPAPFAVPDPPHHPTPNNLDEIEVGTVGGPRRQSIQLARLLCHLSLLVLLAPVVFTLIPDERLNLILLDGGGGVPDDANVVGLVTCADRIVVMRAGVVLDDFIETELT